VKPLVHSTTTFRSSTACQHWSAIHILLTNNPNHFKWIKWCSCDTLEFYTIIFVLHVVFAHTNICARLMIRNMPYSHCCFSCHISCAPEWVTERYLVGSSEPWIHHPSIITRHNIDRPHSLASNYHHSQSSSCALCILQFKTRKGNSCTKFSQQAFISIFLYHSRNIWDSTRRRHRKNILVERDVF